MRLPLRDMHQTRREALAPRLFAVLFLVLGLVIVAAQVRAEGPGPLEGRFFGNANGRVLVVTLHGDLSSGANAEYQYGIARRIAQGNSDVIAFGMIRPGYRDDSGLRSPGSNTDRRDHYTSRNNQLVAETIENLKAATGAERVVVLGHSGGAAQLGAVIGRFPGLVDSAILVSCPCDIRRWRQMRGRGEWRRSQSPNRFANRVPASTRVIAVTGSNDDNTFPVLAQTYIADLQGRGIAAAYVEVPGADHSYRSVRQTAERAAIQETRR